MGREVRLLADRSSLNDISSNCCYTSEANIKDKLMADLSGTPDMIQNVVQAK